MSGTGLMMAAGITPIIPTVIQYVGFVDGGSPAGSTGSSFTFNSTNISGPGLIVISVSAEGSTAAYTVTGVTVNGASATVVSNPTPVLGGNYTSAGLFQYVVASGTTANIVATFSTTINRTRLGIWRITDYVSTTPIATSTTNIPGGGTSINTTLTSMQKGAAIVGVCTTGDVTPHTWTNLTENFDGAIASSVVGTGTNASGASGNAVNGNNITITTSAASTGQALILTAAAWR